MRGKKLTLEIVRTKFLERGYELLESEYINANTKMKYQCPKHPGKETAITYGKLSQGRGCPYCAGKIVEIHKLEVDGKCLDARKCTECGEVKPLDEFVRASSKKNGKSAKCKECNRKWRQENRELTKRSHDKWVEENIERVRENGKRWRQENRKHLKDKAREYWESISQEKREEINAKTRIRYKENIIFERERNKKYRQKNPLNVLKRKHIRRAKQKSLVSNLTDRQTKQLLHTFDNSCALTGLEDDVHIEHFIPLSWGHGGTYIGNVYPMDGSLNLSKFTNNPFDWIKREEIKQKVDLERWEKLISYLSEMNNLTTSEFEQFVYWCNSNKRTIEQIKDDGDKSSVQIWKEKMNIECEKQMTFF